MRAMDEFWCGAVQQLAPRRLASAWGGWHCWDHRSRGREHESCAQSRCGGHFFFSATQIGGKQRDEGGRQGSRVTRRVSRRCFLVFSKLSFCRGAAAPRFILGRIYIVHAVGDQWGASWQV